MAEQPPPTIPVPALVIFDKDGTLIDYHAMWSTWIETVAHALSAAADQPLTGGYYAFVGYDAVARRTLPGGRLAKLTMATMYAQTATFLLGLGVPNAGQVLAEAWSAPDPVRDAHPTTDLRHLFTTLRGLGCRLCVATSDDHAPAVDTLNHLNVLDYVDFIVGADDGVPVKPEPDMVRHLCALTGIPVGQAMVVGDTLDDMHMAKAAGVTAIGVLTGITPAEMLRAEADYVLDHAGLVPTLFAG